MSVRACVSGACRACVARITLCIISRRRRALIHSITHALVLTHSITHALVLTHSITHALVLTHAHGHANSKRAEINCNRKLFGQATCKPLYWVSRFLQYKTDLLEIASCTVDAVERMASLKLTGKVALVTGGAQGLGLATVHMLLNHGAKVIDMSRV